MFKRIFQKNFKFTFYLLITIFLTLGVSISLQSLLAAWTPPTEIPTGGMPDAPLNEGVADQIKLGGLTIEGAFKADASDNTLVVNAANNRVGIGTANPSVALDVDGDIEAGGFFYESDERLKKDIVKIDNALEKVQELEGVSFKWKKDDEKKDLGLIAQAVEKVFPELVHTSKIDGLKSVEYANLIAPVIEAIKELGKKVNDLFDMYFDQQEQIDDLQKQILNLENKIIQ